MEVWLEDAEGVIKTVVMKYHTSITFFTLDPERIDGIVAVIDDVKPFSITSTKTLIKRIMPLTSMQYHVTFGFIARYTTYRDYDNAGMIEMATEEDMREIAELIMSDEGIGSYYEIHDFEEQLKERLRTGMGRNFIIRKDGKIIAHTATYAEMDDIAVGSGLIVHPDYRNLPYSTLLESYITKTMLSEGKSYYGFMDERHMRIVERLGNVCAGEYGKLFIKLNEYKNE